MRWWSEPTIDGEPRASKTRKAGTSISITFATLPFRRKLWRVKPFLGIKELRLRLLLFSQERNLKLTHFPKSH